jgi:hypothetical protein
MATITAQTILDRATTILQDATNVRWTASELLGWLNDGQREIVLIKPDSFTKNQSMVLVAGTKQQIPSDGIMLIDVVRNMGVDGTTAGNAIRVVSREVLDAVNPDWHVQASNVVAKHFFFDPRDPKRFYVYPKSPGTNYVELVYSASPTDVAAVGNVITLDDIFMGALIDYVLYRAYSKDAEFAANKELAVGHYQAFANALGVKSQTQTATNPNVSQMPFNPNVPGAAK